MSIEIRNTALDSTINGNARTKLGPIAGDLQGTIITDCYDSNARQRQENRYRTLFGERPTFVPLESEHTALEASGQLIDTIDAVTVPKAFKRGSALVLVNAAPRGTETRDEGYENGTPFCYFRQDGNLVFSTYNPELLALARVATVNLLDIPTITNNFVRDGLLTTTEASKINDTQFRSLHFVPLAARVVAGREELPSVKKSIKREAEDVGGRAWFVDNFGNIKTTSLPEDIDYEEGKQVELVANDGEVKTAICVPELADVNTGQLALTIGSSGVGERQWLEVAVGRGNAAQRLGGVAVGDKIFESR